MPGSKLPPQHGMVSICYPRRPKIQSGALELWKANSASQKTTGCKFPRSGKISFLLKKHRCFHFFIIFHHKNDQKLLLFEVLQPWEYDRTLRHNSTALPGTNLIKFHGLGPKLWSLLCLVTSWSWCHDDIIIMISSWWYHYAVSYTHLTLPTILLV